MPWYVSMARVALCVYFSGLGAMQANWIREAEDAYRRSLTWKPAVGTITEHRVILNKVGASHVWYKFSVGGETYTGDRFKSGGLYKEEHLRNASLLGVGTELVVYYNPGDPSENAIKISTDRKLEAFLAFNIAVCWVIAFRSVRCETVLPNLFYRFLNVNRRFAEPTGMRTRRRTGRRPGQGYAETNSN
mmetsp:Transcript_25094/g.77564  ORF Transcript_25094/g.77564 Transcript_25094/m.77564 type:complete len:189 (-) Transcript_25094:45-611(-)